MEGQSPVIQQPTNVTNDDHKSRHPQNPQFSNANVPQFINGQPGYPPVGLPGPPFIFPIRVIANKYDVFDGYGQRIFQAIETTDAWGLYCGGKNRTFTIDIIGFSGQKVLSTKRRFNYCGGDDVIISLGDGTFLGEVHHRICDCQWVENFDITNANGELIMLIQGPDCNEYCRNCVTQNFKIFTTQGEQIGVIRKTFTGFVQELFTDADNFGVEFSTQLDVPTKAMIFGAVFLIDFLFFES